MLPYQKQYVDNVRRIVSLSDFYGGSASGFEAWFERQRAAEREIDRLREGNNALLSGHLFPALDDLHNADPETVADLEEFADQLMDWRTNLDAGVYVQIHDALLSLYRIRKDRDRVIKHLYKLGMGLYYQGGSVQGIEPKWRRPFRFENEMVFTEAGSYLKFFESIEDEATKGYIIRALANISICADDRRRRVAVSARILNIVQDDYYRRLAPGLPWDTFLRRTNQQMSANRNELSRGDLTQEELMAVLESCHAVFQPETTSSTPNVRWLWPYYDMEYSLGLADLPTTLDRLERLIDGTAGDDYDVSGLYGSVQLPLYYGRLLEKNPNAPQLQRRVGFLSRAYQKMTRTLLTCPAEKFDDFFFYLVRQVVTEYYETEGVDSYREVTERLMRRFAGRLYIRSRRTGELLRALCAAMLEAEPDFFDDIPFICAMPEGEEKRRAVLDYADACGLYHDFGLMKMNLERIGLTRSLFEREEQMRRLHAVSGRDDLRRRRSTEIFADVAYGHHRWYNGADGYPDEYERTKSAYRRMTDVVAVAAFLAEAGEADPEAAIESAAAQGQKRFSPPVAAALYDGRLKGELCRILRGDGREYYRNVYDRIAAPETRDDRPL